MDITTHHRISSRYKVSLLSPDACAKSQSLASEQLRQLRQCPPQNRRVFSRRFLTSIKGFAVKVKVLAVYDDSTKADIDAMTSAFASGGITATAVDAAGALAGIAGG